MTNCCIPSDSSPAHPKHSICPVNGKEYAFVSPITILHHIKEPWKWSPSNQGYYFCDDAQCEVVYFAQDNSSITQSSLRTQVGIKEQTISSLICYCFGITKSAAANKNIKNFVIKSTKEKACACSTRNPSGRCCLKDFP